MALMNCPECGKEISDTARSCPNCGYPLGGNPPAEAETEQPAMPSAKVRVSNLLHAHKKLAVFAACVFISLLAVFFVTSRDRYIDTLLKARHEMLMSGAQAEELVTLTHDVWDDTISKRYRQSTAPYTHITISGKSLGYHSDFNDSIAALYASTDAKEIIRKVEESRATIDKLMHSLRNPSKEFEICYDTISSMYDAYCTYTDLASSPTGSLITYTANANQASNVITLSYSRLEDQIPKKRIPIYPNLFEDTEERQDIKPDVPVYNDSDYDACPKRASGIMKVDDIRIAPEVIFTNSEDNKSYRGTMYRFYGVVSSIEPPSETTKNAEAAIISTDYGKVCAVDFYSIVAKDHPEAVTEDLNDRFALPAVGSKVCVFAEYSVYDEDLEMPIAYIGGQAVLNKLGVK